MFYVDAGGAWCIAIILFAYWPNDNYRQIYINESSTRIIYLWNKTSFNCNYNMNEIILDNERSLPNWPF